MRGEFRTKVCCKEVISRAEPYVRRSPASLTERWWEWCELILGDSALQEPWRYTQWHLEISSCSSSCVEQWDEVQSTVRYLSWSISRRPGAKVSPLKTPSPTLTQPPSPPSCLMTHMGTAFVLNERFKTCAKMVSTKQTVSCLSSFLRCRASVIFAYWDNICLLPHAESSVWIGLGFLIQCMWRVARRVCEEWTSVFRWKCLRSLLLFVCLFLIKHEPYYRKLQIMQKDISNYNWRNKCKVNGWIHVYHIKESIRHP